MTKVPHQKNLKSILQNFPRFFPGIWTQLLSVSSVFFIYFGYTFKYFYGVCIIAKQGYEEPK